jgi:hypothetical protein
MFKKMSPKLVFSLISAFAGLLLILLVVFVQFLPKSANQTTTLEPSNFDLVYYTETNSYEAKNIVVVSGNKITFKEKTDSECIVDEPDYTTKTFNKRNKCNEPSRIFYSYSMRDDTIKILTNQQISELEIFAGNYSPDGYQYQNYYYNTTQNTGAGSAYIWLFTPNYGSNSVNNVITKESNYKKIGPLQNSYSGSSPIILGWKNK